MIGEMHKMEKMTEKSSAADSGGRKWQEWQLLCWLCCKVCTRSSPTRHFSHCDTGPSHEGFWRENHGIRLRFLGIDNHDTAVGSESFKFQD